MLPRIRLSLAFLLVVADLAAACSAGPASDATDDHPIVVACGLPSDILDNGQPTGFVRCEDGSIDRGSVVAVDPTIALDACHGDEDNLECSVDTNCSGDLHAKCVHFDSAPEPETDAPGSTCACVSACATDAECGAGRICMPGSLAGGDASACVPATCASNSDCASERCGVATWDNGCGITATLSCRDADDACDAPQDCAAPSACTPGGEFGTWSPWSCQPKTCDM